MATPKKGGQLLPPPLPPPKVETEPPKAAEERLPEEKLEVPEPTITVSEPEAVAVEEKEIYVTPRRTVTSCRIGPQVYSFMQGVRQKVPAELLPHLREKGIV